MSIFAQYVAHGWALCAIEPGKKGPTYADWHTVPIAKDAAEGLDGAGLLHALSGTCALDIDQLQQAQHWLAERGVDLEALRQAPDSVHIRSGRPNRDKLLYRMRNPLRTLKPTGSGLELRCATAEGKSVQDVLPPSVHPDTKKPYEWAYGDPLIGDWRALPPIPAPLLALWRQLVAEAPPAPAERPPGPNPTADRLRALLKAKDPAGPYDDWIKVGMALHDATGGSSEGLALWDEWSAQAPAKYKGTADLKAHWVTFRSTPGKRTVTVATLHKDQPAQPDEFEDIEPDADDAENTATQLRAAAKQLRQDALSRLEARLVFVVNAERYFDCERHRILASNLALEHMFTPWMPRTKQGRGSPIKALKESPTKRVVDGVGFHPGEGVVFKSGEDTYVNTYRNRLPAPIQPMPDEAERIEWLFDRINDVSFREWLRQFFAHVVQKPGVKINSAPLIWSPTQGNGKTTLLRMIPSLLVGNEYSREVTCALLNSDFNDYLLGAWHVNLTEFRAGTRGERTSISSKVKPWIADASIAMHPKGQTAYTMPNCFFVTATSNEDDAALLDDNDRRWAVHELKAPQFTEAEQQWIYNDFLLLPRAAAVLRYYFLHVPLIGFVASAKAPETAARADMIRASRAADQETLETAFEERSGPFSRDVVLTAEVTRWAHKNTSNRPSAARVGRLLCSPPFNGKPIQFRCGAGKFRAVVLFNRARWLGASGKDILEHIEGAGDVDILA